MRGDKEAGVYHSDQVASALNDLPPEAVAVAGLLCEWAKTDGHCKVKGDGQVVSRVGRKGVRVVWMCITVCRGHRPRVGQTPVASVVAWLLYFVMYLRDFGGGAWAKANSLGRFVAMSHQPLSHQPRSHQPMRLQ